MNRSTQRRYNRGFSLLEVLFAVIILAVALLATARLHAMVTQDGSFAKARGIAANLAQEKLDDLKSFTVLYNNPDTPLVNECAAPMYCYSEIGDDTGGQEKAADGSLELISGDITVGNTTYNRTWEVTDYYNCTAASAASTANCAAPNAKPYPDFKAVTLTVTWTDEKGGTQTATLQTAIYASDPGSQARMAASSSGGGPKVSYTPIGIPDAVPVPINTGGTKFKESSKPVPDVVSNGTAAEVSFDAVSYANNGSGGYDTTEREEFTTVSCECSFNSTNTAYTPSRMVWNGSSLEAKVGNQISKPIGTAASGQSDFCTACCKDHHDVGGFAGTAQPKYDPDRPEVEYAADGNHKHYWYSNCVAGTLGKTTCNAANKDPALGYGVVDSGAYLESCRFKRVDGLWRIWQDWRQVKMTVMPYDFLPVSANLDAYVEVIEAVVENTIRTDSSNGTKTIPALTGRDFSFTATGETKQLLGRAVFVDRVYKEDAPTELDTDYYTSLVAKVDASSDWLHLVPFYEANLTLLIDWYSDATTIATVTSQPIVDISDVSSGYYSSYSRGKVTAVAGGTAVITAKARLHNTGVTGGINTSSPSYGIGDYDNGKSPHPSPLTDSITVTVPSSTTNVGINGKLIRANSSVSFSTLSVSGATCTLQSAIGNELPYSCTTTSGTNVTLTYASSASGYNFSPVSQALGVVTSATTVGDVTVYGPTVKISGTFTEVNSPNLAKVDVKAVSTSGATTTCSVTNSNVNDPGTYTCTVSRGTMGFTGTVEFTETSSSVYTFSPTSPHNYTSQQADIVQNVTVTKN